MQPCFSQNQGSESLAKRECPLTLLVLVLLPLPKNSTQSITITISPNSVVASSEKYPRKARFIMSNSDIDIRHNDFWEKVIVSLRGSLAKLSLQGSSVDAQPAGRLGDISATVGQDSMDMFPFGLGQRRHGNF